MLSLETGPDMRPRVSVLICLTSSPRPKTPNRQQTLIRQRKFNCNENTGAASPEAACLLAARTPRKLVQREIRKQVRCWTACGRQHLKRLFLRRTKQLRGELQPPEDRARQP